VATDLVYVVATPSPNRNCEMDRVASALGTSAVHLIFMQPVWQSASWQPTFPKVCPYHCVDSSPEWNGIPFAELSRLLEQLDPRVVVVGGFNQRVARRVISWCRQRGVPYCLRSDSNIWTDKYKGVLKYLFRRTVLRPKVRAARKCLLTGETNRAFWEHYGMRREQAGWWPQWIDYDRFIAARELRRTAREQLRDQYQIKCPLNLLYVGRLIPLKHLERVAEALVGLPEEIGLVLVGQGPEEQRLRAEFGDKLGKRLHFVGAVESEEMPRLYALGDALVLATGPRENWGLVLNEAAAVGLPMICSAQIGAAADLLVHGRNGYAVEVDDVEHWRNAIRQTMSNPSKLATMGEQSMAIIDDWRARSEPVACVQQILKEAAPSLPC
jgi:glycosyltransferase involved in cell wall biosynthesis